MAAYDRNRAPLDVLLAAVVFALVTGVVEVIIAGVDLFVIHQFAWVSHDVIWLTPLAESLAFCVLALPLAVLAWLAPRRVTLPVATGLFGFLCVLSLLLLWPKIAAIASVILSAGIGAQLGRLVSRDAVAWRGRLARIAIALAALVALGGIGQRGWVALRERRALASLVAAPSGAPNVLFIVFDTVRRANMHVYGYARANTPQLDRRAAESTLFDYAMSPAPWTLPSHASMFTGRDAGTLRGSWQVPYDAPHRSLAESLRDRGWVTAGFVANQLYTGFESGLARGFIHYDDFPLSLASLRMHSILGRSAVAQRAVDHHDLRDLAKTAWQQRLKIGGVPADAVRPANSVTDAFLDWQRGAGPRPFFAFLNYFDAHGPYRSPDEYAARFGTAPRQPVDKYDAAIAWLDHEAGRLLDSLQQRGVLDHTIVLIVGDHGDHFGEHGLKGHANSLYLPLLNVPLILRYPGKVPAGRRVTEAVTTTDVAATVLDLAGLSRDLPGSSLARTWLAIAPDTAPAPLVANVIKGVRVDTSFGNYAGPMRGIMDQRLHYIRDGHGRESLFAWRTDSLELHNLVGDPALQGELARLKRQLDSASAGWTGAALR